MGCHAQSTNEVSIFWCHIPNFSMLKKDKKKTKQTKTPICFKVFSLPWRGALQIVTMDKSLNGFASFMFFFTNVVSTIYVNFFKEKVNGMQLRFL